MTSDPQAIRQAVRLLETDRLEQAERLCRQILHENPKAQAALHVLGLVQQRRGNLNQAIELLRRAVQLNDSQAMAHFNLGVVLQAAGQWDEALRSYHRTTELAPNYAPAHNNVGAMLHRKGAYDQAVGCFDKALQLDPNHADAASNLGAALIELGRFADAEPHLHRAAALHTQTADHHRGLGDSLRLQQRHDEAKKSYQQAQALNGRCAATYLNLGIVCRELGKTHAAGRHLRKAIEAAPDFMAAHRGLAVVLKELGDLDGALAAFDKALQLAPGDPDTIAAQAGTLEMRGEFELAWSKLQPLVDTGQVNVNVAMAFASVSRRVDRMPQAVQLSETLLSTRRLSTSQQTLMHFAAGQLLDSMDQFDRAFEHLTKGNDLRAQRYEPAEQEAMIDRTMQVFSAEAMSRLPRAAVGSDRPVFIVGMPRSGTTLVEQIISSHPDVHGAGELHEIIRIVNGLHTTLGCEQRYPEAAAALTADAAEGLAQRYLGHLHALSPDAKRVTDKMPQNYQHLGLIALLLPRARVIHCRRDVRDTCLSCYFQNFSGHQTFAYDLRSLGHYYRQYEKLMAHWQQVVDLPMMTVCYEQLVDDSEAQSRRLIEFCGLPWDDQCLRFYETKRDVPTSSFGQVRRPIYRSQVDRWRRYQQHLKPLFEALDQ